jgi:type II secretory pathway component PulJ
MVVVRTFFLKRNEGNPNGGCNGNLNRKRLFNRAQLASCFEVQGLLARSGCIQKNAAQESEASETQMTWQMSRDQKLFLG